MTVDLKTIVKLQMVEIDRLRALVGRKDQELDVLVGWIAGDQDALGALQSVYADPRSKTGDKVRSAAAALPFERAKPPSTAVVLNFGDVLQQARLRHMERERERLLRGEKPAINTLEPSMILDQGEDDPPAA
jgi:hypothetical protein